MKRTLFITLLSLLLGLTSCIEIIDDITFNLDGSGSLNYTINLSSSKIKINSILALDSIEGQPVPSIHEIERKIEAFKTSFASKDGISNVSMESDFTNYLFKLKCDFESIEALQAGIKEVVVEFSKKKNLEGLDHDWLSWDRNSLVRSIPEFTIEKTKQWKAEDIEQMKQGIYMSITRFEGTVDHVENKNAVISKNRKAVMIKTNPHALMENHHLLENIIYLEE